MGIVATITSGKGGVGKSTVTAGLGSALARRGKRVLLIDAEAGLRGLDYMMGAAENVVYDFSDVISGGCDAFSAVYDCNGGLYLMPAPFDIKDDIKKENAKELIESLKLCYDYVLIDCPAGIGSGFEVSAVAADRALVVVNPDPIGVRCAKYMDQALDKMDVTDKRLVINRFSADEFERKSFYKDLDEVIDAAGIRLISVIPEDIELFKASVKGEIRTLTSFASKAFDRMAARFEGENVPLDLKGKR